MPKVDPKQTSIYSQCKAPEGYAVPQVSHGGLMPPPHTPGLTLSGGALFQSPHLLCRTFPRRCRCKLCTRAGKRAQGLRVRPKGSS
jgi:hypothetical protein